MLFVGETSTLSAGAIELPGGDVSVRTVAEFENVEDLKRFTDSIK